MFEFDFWHRESIGKIERNGREIFGEVSKAFYIAKIKILLYYTS